MHSMYQLMDSVHVPPPPGILPLAPFACRRSPQRLPFHTYTRTQSHTSYKKKKQARLLQKDGTQLQKHSTAAVGVVTASSSDNEKDREKNEKQRGPCWAGLEDGESPRAMHESWEHVGGAVVAVFEREGNIG